MIQFIVSGAMSNETKITLVIYIIVLILFSLLFLYHFYQEGSINL